MKKENLNKYLEAEIEKNRTIYEERDRFRAMIINEEALINRRLTWLFQIQIPIVVAVVAGVATVVAQKDNVNMWSLFISTKWLFAMISFFWGNNFCFNLFSPNWCYCCNEGYWKALGKNYKIEIKSGAKRL